MTKLAATSPSLSYRGNAGLSVEGLLGMVTTRDRMYS
jgi:hypothetical protein